MEQTLLAQVEAAERLDPAFIASAINGTRLTLHAAQLRLTFAQGAGDDESIKGFQAEIVKDRKKEQFLLERLKALAPDYSIPPAAFKEVERAVVVNDYLELTRAKARAKLDFEAADYLGDEAGKARAREQMQRIQRYLAQLKPKFERIAQAEKRKGTKK